MLQEASSSAISVVNTFRRLHEMNINMKNFRAVQETIPALPVGKSRIEPPFHVQFEKVSFAYPGTTEQVVNSVDFIVEPGDRLAIVGENGAGKSTLLKLLLRQYLPSGGRIVINGVDMADINMQHYYEHVSNLSQSAAAFAHLTVRENITIGLSRKVTDTELYDVLKLVGADSFVRSYKHGLDQRLDSSFDDGVNPSGGQMQRLCIARALLRKADLVILDEPTSAIDAKGEFEIFSNIFQSHSEATIIIVSHRFSTVRKADHIIVLDDGTISEQGSHEELITQCGLYREMFELQAEGYR
jgi:ABC-type multidrug transport system fused ATPase/permease subunit